LLSLQDPEVARIKESFEREGQREPVKARVLKILDGGLKGVVAFDFEC